MLYNDFAITINKRSGAGYPITIVAQGLGRITGKIALTSGTLKSLLAEVTAEDSDGNRAALARKAGIALFQWLLTGPAESHLRVAWDRAEQIGHGLRLRLSIDSPSLAALPWELLHDPLRDHCFATSISTPLVRFLDQADQLGKLARLETELPLNMLLVLPQAPDLNQAQEKAVIHQAINTLSGAIKLDVLDGQVTRLALSDALMATQYDIVHVTGHGGYSTNQSYIALNKADGEMDWVNGSAAARIFGDQRRLKLVVLNACSSGQIDEGTALRGLAPQLVFAGVPAVVAMQYPLSDQAALTFAREFYRQLCIGENAGQVDVAVSHARNMLSVMFPDSASFTAPLLYTYAADGVIYTLPTERAVQAILDPTSESARLAMFVSSLQSSQDFGEDWALADRESLESWRETLLWAERAYCTHLEGPTEAARQVAQQGLALVQARLANLEAALTALRSS